MFSLGLLSSLHNNGMKTQSSTNGSRLHLSKHYFQQLPFLIERGKRSLYLPRVCSPVTHPTEAFGNIVVSVWGGLMLKAKAPTVYLSSHGLVGPFSSPTLGQQGKNAIRNHLFTCTKGIYYVLVYGLFKFVSLCLYR